MSEPELDCNETFARLDDYLDRELSPAEIAAVERHLERCLMCSGEFETEQALLDNVRRKLQRIRLPAGLSEKIAARLRQA